MVGGGNFLKTRIFVMPLPTLHRNLKIRLFSILHPCLCRIFKFRLFVFTSIYRKCILLLMLDLLNQYLSTIYPAAQTQRYKSPLLQATMEKNAGADSSLFDQAKQMYPRLQSMDIGYKENFGRGPGYLEYWPAGEEGAPNRVRPIEFPIDKPGVEVRSRATRPEDVMADIASHHMVYNDPVMKKIYGDFENSLTEDQQKRLKEQYVHYITNEHNPESKTPTYKEWYDRTGLPGWFRGYTFNQWPEDFTSQVYTPQQRKLLDKATQYLKSK